MTSNIAAPHLEGRPRLTGPTPDGAPALTLSTRLQNRDWYLPAGKER